jgi:hypothetical protein
VQVLAVTKRAVPQIRHEQPSSELIHYRNIR